MKTAVSRLQIRAILTVRSKMSLIGEVLKLLAVFGD